MPLMIVVMLFILLAFISSADAVTLSGSSEYSVPGSDFTLTCDVTEEANVVSFYRRPDVSNPVGSVQVSGSQCYNPAVLCTSDVCSCVITSTGGRGTVFRWVIQPQTGDHGSVWFCRRTNLNLTDQILESPDYTISVAAGPGNSILLSPSDAVYTKTEGDTLPGITCTADCRPGCTYVWTKHDNTNFTTSAVLSLGQLDRSEHGEYRCTARNTVGESATTIRVAVQYGPGNSVLLQPQQNVVDIVENQTLTNVNCSADCRPSCSYTWSKSGKSYSNPLSLYLAKRDNAGNYTCTASNTVSGETKMWILFVRFPPRILSLNYTKGGADVTENGPKSLICVVESSPPSTIQWYFKANNSVLLSTPNVLQSTYTLTTAGCLDTGLYTCSAMNSVSGRAVTIDIGINVLCKPRQDPRAEADDTFGLGISETLVINAMFLSNPEPSITWTFQKQTEMGSTYLVNGEDNFNIYTTFETTNLSSMSVGTRTNMQETWFGVYNVTASNSQGSENLRFTAVAKGKPSPPYGGTAVCPDVDQAVLSWTSGFNGGSSQTFIVGIRNDMQSSITIDRSTNQTDPGHGNFVTTTVYGLRAETKHFFTVYAVNKIGNSSFPEEVNCTTKAKPQGSPLAAIFGGLGGAAVGLSVLVSVVIIKRKTSENKRKGADEEMISVDQRRSVDEESSDGMKPNIIYESAGLKPNVLYESSGPLPGRSSEYAVVEKSSKKKSVSPDAVYAVVDKSKKPETTNDVYAEVVKPKIKKGKEKKKQGNVKQKGGFGKSEGNDVYANCKGGEKKVPKAGLNRQKNQDGLIYLDVEFKGEQEKGMFTVIHGVENRSDYADVDFTKHAEPLPQENEQPTEDVNVK